MRTKSEQAGVMKKADGLRGGGQIVQDLEILGKVSGH